MFSFLTGSADSADSKPSSDSVSNGSADAEQISTLKSEVESLRKLLAKTEAKAAAAEALNDDGSDASKLKTQLLDTQHKLELSKKELADAVQKYRILVIDSSKAAQLEVVTNEAIKATIQQQKDDFKFRDGTDKMAGLQAELDKLKAQLAEKDKKIDGLTKEFQDKHAEWVDKTDKLVAQMGEHKEGHSKVLNTVVGELEEQQKALNQVKDNQGDKDAQTQKATKEAAKASEKLDAAEKAKEQLQGELQSLSSQLSEMSETSSKLTSTNSALNQQITDARNKQIGLEGQIDDLNNKLKQAARDKEAELAALERKLDALKDKLLDTENELSKANDELTRAVADVAKAKAAQDALNKLLADQRDLTDKTLNSKEAAHAGAAAASKQMADLIADAAAKDEAHKIERKTLLGKIDDLLRSQTETQNIPLVWQKKLDDANAAKAKDINSMLDSHAKQNEANSQQIKQLKAVNDNLIAQNEDLTKKLALMSRQMDQDKARISALENDLKTTKEKYADLPNQLSAAKMERDQYKKLYEDQIPVINDLRRKQLDLQGELAESQSKLAASQSSSESNTNSILKEMNDSKQQNAFLRDKVADLQTQIAGLDADIANLERQKLELTAGNAALKAENKQLQGDLDDSQAALKEKETQLTTETITKTMRLPEGLQDKIDTLTTQLKQVQSLTVAIQMDMVPEEVTTVDKTTASTYETSSSSSGSKK